MANYGKKDLWLIAWTLRRTEKSIKQKINKLLKKNTNE
jgi:hypothetical protein